MPRSCSRSSRCWNSAAAGRVDDYTGFGSTFNPKFTAKFRPVDWLMFRGSYNTGFRVPSFNQIFNGVTQSPNPGNTLVDPTTCPPGAIVGLVAGCTAITPDSLSGGNLTLRPETSKQYSGGVVFQPSRHFSASADYWNIAVDNVIGTITIPQLLANINAFPDRISGTNGSDHAGRSADGQFRLAADAGHRFHRARQHRRARRHVCGRVRRHVAAGQEGEAAARTWPTATFSAYSRWQAILACEFKYNAFVSYQRNNFSLTFSQLYRGSYQNFALPASATRPDYNPRVKPYITYNMSASQRINDRLTLTAGIKNLFNADPPFAITYDSNTGAGSSWEPRDTDPRGRSFTMQAEVKF